MKLLKSHKTFEGLTQSWSHFSNETKTEMRFSSFTPPGDIRGCIIWLPDLGQSYEDFLNQSCAQMYLAEEGLMLVSADTSPRGLNLIGEHDSFDFGSGASFYLDATVPPYSQHYLMYSYIVDELYELIVSEFGVDNISISGHSMGGHGALVIGLKNPSKFRSLSALSPIVNPIFSPWGRKAFRGFLGEDQNQWLDYDACELLKKGFKHPSKILIDQGSQDEHLEKQLLTKNFIAIANVVDQDHLVHICDGYDHSFFFVATYIGEHIRHHARHLRGEL